MKMMRQTMQAVRAPELYGDHWYNSPPLSLRSAEGQNVLLFFWNYSTPSSLRLLSAVKQVVADYEELGLLCIGVHSPEFEFARHQKKVDEILKRYGIVFPVVADSDRLIAEAYRITDFPAVVLIGANGNIYDSVTHLSSLARIERSIQYLLRQSGFFGELPTLRSLEEEHDIARISTEITTGYLHGSLGNPEGYSPELPAEYRDPGVYVEGKFYAHGIWHAERNAFRYAGAPNEGYLLCRTDGDNIDALIGAEQRSSLIIRLGSVTVPLEQMGADVKRDAKGTAGTVIGEPQFVSLYRAVSEEPQTITFVPAHTGITFYKFSFYRNAAVPGDLPPIGSN